MKEARNSSTSDSDYLDHRHHHDHSHTSLTDHNRAYFDNIASTYTTKANRDFPGYISTITNLVVSNLPLHDLPAERTNPPLHVLDYACGPGIVTSILSSHVPPSSEFIGLDLSENMAAEYNKEFASSQIKAEAYAADLLNPSAPSPAYLFRDPKLSNFDIVAVSGAFHHFPDLKLATQRLSDRLRPGGVLIIIDFVKTQHSSTEQVGKEFNDHPARKTVAHHHGFTEGEVRDLFDGVGLGDFAFVEGQEVSMMDGKVKRGTFLARGRKSA